MQKYISFFGYFELYIKFSNLVQWAILHYNLFKYLFKTSTKIMGYQWQYIIQLYAKIHWCSLKNLSKSTPYSFWSSLVICTATIFLLALLPMILFPTHRPPCKTLKSRRVDPLEDFKCMQQCLLLSVQNQFSHKLALTNLH